MDPNKTTEPEPVQIANREPAVVKEPDQSGGAVPGSNANRPGTTTNYDQTRSYIYLAILLLFVTGFGMMMSQYLQPPPVGGLEVGQPAPPIKAIGWLNGEPLTAEDLEDKVVVVTAWATWCINCRREAPEMIAVYEQFEEEPDVVFLGLTAQPAEVMEQMRAYIEGTEIPWVNGYGAVETLVGLKAEAIPATWVISKDGQIVWNRDSHQPLEAAIRSELDATSAE